MLQEKKLKPHGKDPMPSKQRAKRLELGGLKDIQFKRKKNQNKKGGTAVMQWVLLLQMR